MTRPLRATVDTSALAHNLEVARQSAAQARVFAVVKADGYGHGLDAAVRGLAGADGFALLETARAFELRESFPDHRVLLLEGAFDARGTAQAIDAGIDLVVHAEHQVEWLEALEGPRRANLWLKFNSGMHRLGFGQAAFRKAFERLVGAACVARIGLMTHFANADLEDGATDALARFERAAAGLPGRRTLSNSAACLSMPAARGDWIRPGIMLYGASPFADRSAESLGLRPAMHLDSALIAVQSLLPGDAVGYGGTFVAGRPMRIGVVACGYADGYPRSAPTGTPVWVAGKRTRTVGRVSMDMLTVDLDPIPEAAVGSPVQLWGGHVPIDDVATHAGTIGYELMCRLARRVPVTVVGDPP